MKLKTSAVLMLPSLSLLAASLQAADVNPVWVEYTPVSASAASEQPLPAIPSATTTATALAAPVNARPATATAAPASRASITVAASQGTETAMPDQQTVASPASTGMGLSNSGAALAPNGVAVTSQVAPKLYAFDYFKGVGAGLPHYLERYDYREGLDGDTRSGLYADVDLKMAISNGERDLFVIDRQGFGQHNHRGLAKFDDDEMSLSGNYSHYRSTTGGLDYLYSPAVVAGADVPADPNFFTFVNNTGTSQYHIDRTTYGATLKLKPTLLGGVHLSVDYEGYKREGNQLATSIINIDDTTTPVTRFWSGNNLAIDERMNKVGLTLAASPKGLFEVAYTVSFEKFTNQAKDLTSCADILAGTAYCGGAGINPTSRQGLAPYYFVPDTSLIAQNIRVTKPIGEQTVISGGYGYSTLDQDNFPERITTSHDPYTNGEINSQNAYFVAKTRLTPKVGIEGHIKYYSRDNDSSFPVDYVIGLGAGGLGRLTGPRINSIDSTNYGLEGDWRPGVMSSTLYLGWQHLDQQRDLAYRLNSEGIPADRILYREDTQSDDIYLKWIARPAPGVTIRLTPTYTWADKTGLVTEPEEALKIKAMASYAAPAGWLISGFYDYKNKKNNDLSVTGSTGIFTQDVESTFHSAGVSLNVMPRESINTSLNLYWMQNDLASYLLATDITRGTGNAAVAFSNTGLSNYRVDSYVASLAADWRTTEALKLSGSYTFTQNKGNTASGAVLAALQAATGTIDSLVDNSLHSLMLGADYTLNPKTTLRTNYIYDYYDDNAYSLLTGGVHTLTLGVSFMM